MRTLVCTHADHAKTHYVSACHHCATERLASPNSGGMHLQGVEPKEPTNPERQRIAHSLSKQENHKAPPPSQAAVESWHHCGVISCKYSLTLPPHPGLLSFLEGFIPNGMQPY